MTFLKDFGMYYYEQHKGTKNPPNFKQVINLHSRIICL